MLFVFIIGLLLRLSAVQGSTSSYLPEIPPRNSNLASAEQNSANEVSLPFDGISPRFWFGQGYRQAFKQIIQFYNDQLLMDKGSDSGKDLNMHGGNEYKSEEQAILDRVMKERIPSLSSEEQSSVEKRDSPISMCYFKLCNLGRKRRISQAGGLVPNAYKSE